SYRVPDHPIFHLLVAHQSRENRETRGVGRGPAGGAKRIGIEVEDGAGAGSPASVSRIGGIELVQFPVVAIDDQDVPVAGTPRATFDGRIGRDRVGPRITLVRVVEGDGALGRRPAHYDVGNAVGRLG